MNRTHVLATVIFSCFIILYINQYSYADPSPIILSPPTNLSANPVSSSEIDLTWTAPTNISGVAITGYMIERSTDGGITWNTIVDNTNSADTTYQDTGLVSDTTYTYRVSAITVLFTSKPSNTVSATPQSTTSQLTVNSQDNKGDALPGFHTVLYQNGNWVDAGYTPHIFTLNSGETYTLVTDIGYDKYAFDHWLDTNSTSYSRTVTISSDQTITAVYSTTPQPPTGLISMANSSSQIDLSWNAPTDNGGSTITGYKISRSTDNGVTWTLVISNTKSTLTKYSDTGLTPNTTYMYRVFAINAVGTSTASNTTLVTTQNNIHNINQIKSGLVVTDPLNNETRTQQQLQTNPRYWSYGGDAPLLGAQYDFFKDIQGLHIGSRIKSNNTWAGYFAVSPNTNATLFHAVIDTPLRSIPYGYFENGMYVQTAQPFINYVTCVSVTSQFGTVWAVVSTTGNATQANQFNILYVNDSQNQPLTRDCTIITNGNNYLKVYLDGTMVYKNSTMNLQMPEPFNTYLEPQSSYTGQLLNGSYTNYYVTTDENVKVINLPSNAARADLVDSSGAILASSQVSNGIISFEVGKYDFPFAANIRIYDSSNTLIASTNNTTSIYGGNVYSVS